MSGPTPYSGDGKELFTEERPAVVILGDLLDYIQEMRKLYDDTQELYQVLQDNLSFIGSGSPKGVYPTLSALQTAKPTGDNFIYVVTENGNWYYWNGTAWTSGGVYQATLTTPSIIKTNALSDGSVTPVKTSFLQPLTVNMIDPSKFVNGYVDNTGMIVDHASFKTSGYVKVEEGKTYQTNSGGASGGYYKEDLTFVQSIPYNATKPYTVPTGLGINYVRLPFSTSQQATARMNEGSTLLDFTPFTSDVVLQSSVKVRKVNIDGTLDLDVYPEQNKSLTKTLNIFDKQKIKKGVYVNPSNGSLLTDSDQNYCVVAMIPCKPNTLYQKTGNYPLAFYTSSKTFISGIGFGVSARSFTTPENAEYMSVTLYLTQDNPDIYMVYEGSKMPERYVPPYESVYLNGQRTPLSTVEFVSYGDSLTEMNVWQDIVASKLGLKSVVRGIGSTTIVEKGSIAWVDANGKYLARPPETQPQGSTQILSSLVNDQRIATIPTTAKVITLFGGTNDLYMNVPIGTSIDFNDPSTFKSAYALTIKKILLRCPRARLFTVTPPQNNKGTSTNNAGHTTKDYADAIKEVSHLYGIPCIDLFGECGFNEYNLSLYLSDGVHPLDTGATRMQEVIYNGMKNIVDQI